MLLKCAITTNECAKKGGFHPNPYQTFILDRGPVWNFRGLHGKKEKKRGASKIHTTALSKDAAWLARKRALWEWSLPSCTMTDHMPPTWWGYPARRVPLAKHLVSMLIKTRASSLHPWLADVGVCYGGVFGIWKPQISTSSMWMSNVDT